MRAAVIVVVCAPFLPGGKKEGIRESSGCPESGARFVGHSPSDYSMDCAELEHFIVRAENLRGHFGEDTHSSASMSSSASKDCS